MLKKRTIKSFVNRKGRESSSDIEAIQKAKDAGVLIFPKGNVIRFKKNFKNENDVVIDIGFGNGNLLYEIAKKNSDINFVGIEVYKHGVGKLLKKIIQTNIKNINVFNRNINLVFTIFRSTHTIYFSLFISFTRFIKCLLSPCKIGFCFYCCSKKFTCECSWIKLCIFNVESVDTVMIDSDEC